MWDGYRDAFPLKRETKFNLMLDMASRGLSDTEVAKATGYGRGTLSRWRNGVRNPSLQAFEDVLNYCGYELVMRKKDGR